MEITARLTADAQVNTLKDERQVVNFNVAINDSYKPGQSEHKPMHLLRIQPMQSPSRLTTYPFNLQSNQFIIY